jgi:hypothetical protein
VRVTYRPTEEAAHIIGHTAVHIDLLGD